MRRPAGVGCSNTLMSGSRSTDEHPFLSPCSCAIERTADELRGSSLLLRLYFSLPPLGRSGHCARHRARRARRTPRSDPRQHLFEDPAAGGAVRESPTSLTSSGWVLGVGLLAATWSGLAVIKRTQNAFNFQWGIPPFRRPSSSSFTCGPSARLPSSVEAYWYYSCH